jgi:hypothetical protein
MIHRLCFYDGDLLKNMNWFKCEKEFLRKSCMHISRMVLCLIKFCVVGLGVGVLVVNATFNNITAIPWWIVLLVDKAGVHLENYRPAASHWQTLSHNIALSKPRLNGIRTHNVSGDRH